MARLSQLQGEAIHLETLKSDGKRRHPSYCVFADGKGKKRICTSPQSMIYNQHCNTSVRCDYYEEKN